MKSKQIAVVACSLLALAVPLAADGGKKDLREEIEELKAGQQKIQKDLAEIKKLLEARPAPAAQGAARRSGANVENVVFDLGDNPVKGESTAKLTLVEFSDYQ